MGTADTSLLFAAGPVLDDGAVVGCWFVDPCACLRPRRPRVVAHGTAWCARRSGTFPIVTVRDLPPSTQPVVFLALAPDQTPSRDLRRVTMHDLLGLVREVAGILADGTDAPSLGAAHAAVAPSEDRSAFVARARDDLAAARAALDPFLLTLDPEAVDLVRRHDHDPVQGEVYGWIDRTFVPDAPLAAAWRRRPWISGTLTAMLIEAPDAFLRAARKGPAAFDGHLRGHFANRVARPCGDWPGLLDLVEEIGPDLPEEPLRTPLSYPSRHTGPVEDPTVRAAKLLSRLPASWMPRSRAAWEAFAACAPALEVAVARAPLGRAGAMLNARGDWEAARSRLAAAHGGRADAGTLSQRLTDVSDVARAYEHQVLVPAVTLAGRSVAPHGMCVQAWNLLAAGRTVARLLEVSRRWHGHAAAMRAAMPASALSDAWEAALPDFASGGVTLCVIVTRRGLVDEGAKGDDAHGIGGLNHCVGGYAGACLRGERRILSVRGRDDAGRPVRLSTLEVSVARGRVRAHQHAGLLNGVPPRVARDAVADYLAAFAEGALRAPDALPVVRGTDQVSDQAGYDVRVPGAWEAVRDMWDQFLPGPTRDLDAAALAALASLPELAARDHGWRPTPYGAADARGPALAG